MPTRRALWPALLLVPLCAALYLPGLDRLPPIDRDEARYAQATRQMLASGDWVVPHLQGAPRLIKPIGSYWLQAVAAGRGAARAPIARHRLPSVCGALLAVLATYAIGRRWFATRVAWLAAAALACSALLVVEAHLATTDATLLACIAIAQGCLATLYDAVRRNRGGAPGVVAGFWLALAAGVLIKGPVAPLVVAATIAALAIADRGVARSSLVLALRPLWGMPLALACLAPWVLALGSTVGWRALPAAMAADLLPKLLGAHESHGAPPGAYLLSAPATFWPGSIALLFGAAAAWRRRRRPAERFLLAWLLPTWLLFECLPTKLPHYVLPIFPALALLTARAALAAPARLRPAPRHAVVRGLASGWALLTVTFGLGALAVALWLGDGTARAAGLLAAVAAALIATLALQRMWRGQVAAALWLAILGSAAVYAPLLAGVLPNLDALWASRAATAAIARADAGRPLAAAGFHEPSLIFLTRSDITLLDGAAAADFLAARADALVLVGDDERLAFVTAARQRGLALRSLWSAPVLNYSRGRWIDLDLVERAP